MGQFIKFLIVGASNTIVSYLSYVFLIMIGSHYLAANVVSYFVGVLNSFFWNSRFVFKLGSVSWRRKAEVLLKTLCSNAFTGLLFNNILLIVWIEVLRLPSLLGPLFNLLFTMPLNYLLSKNWAYRKKDD